MGKEFEPGLISSDIRFACVKHTGMIQSNNGGWVSAQNYCNLSRQLDRAVQQTVELGAERDTLRAEVERLTGECNERVAEKMEWLSERNQLNKEVARLNAMVTYDCQEPGVCPEVQDLTDALQLMTEQRDGAAALLKAAEAVRP